MEFSLSADTTPTLRQLHILKTEKGTKIRVIKRLTPVWKVIGDLLDFDSSGSDDKLSFIESEYPGDPQSCCRAVLQYWLIGNGVKPCSWRKLLEIIEDADQESLAEEILAALS